MTDIEDVSDVGCGCLIALLIFAISVAPFVWFFFTLRDIQNGVNRIATTLESQPQTTERSGK